MKEHLNKTPAGEGPHRVWVHAQSLVLSTPALAKRHLCPARPVWGEAPMPDRLFFQGYLKFKFLVIKNHLSPTGEMV